MSDQPFISVIVPVYNVELYIRRCLDSLVRQDYYNLEFILVDDGSPDGCPAICDEYAECDERFVVVHQSNKGASGARNAGLDIARGDFVTFCDPDDWTEPGLYSTLYSAIAQTGAEIAVCGHFMEWEDGEHQESRVIRGAGGELTQEKALEYLVDFSEFEGYTWNKLISAALLNKIGETPLRFETDIHICEDTLFFCSCFMNTDKIAYAARPLYHYLIRENSLLHSYNEKRKTELLAWEKIIALTASLNGKANMIARSRQADSAINLLWLAKIHGNTIEAGERRELIKKRVGRYLLDPTLKIKQKFRALMIVYFIDASDLIWGLLKTKLNMTWWK